MFALVHDRTTELLGEVTGERTARIMATAIVALLCVLLSFGVGFLVSVPLR